MNRIYLRALEPEDYEKINQWRADEEIAGNTCGQYFFVSRLRERNWVEEKSLSDQKDLYLAICLSDGGTFIGYQSLINIDWRIRKAEFGFIIGEKIMWNQGYGTEAASNMLKYAFGQMNLHRIYAYVLEKNVSSLRVFDKLGFKKEGMLRDAIFKDGIYQNQFLLSILKDDYRQGRSAQSKISL